MTIRGDLRAVEDLISRLLSIGAEFHSKDSWWSHLKNNEDWRRVYGITDQRIKAKIERIYSDGRDMELFMSNALESINFDFTTYPTLTSIVSRFKGTWVYGDLEPILVEAQKAYKKAGLNIWAFSQMVETFQEQIKLSKVVQQTLDLLKDSDLYRLENGLLVSNKTSHITIGNVTNSNIAMHSENVVQSFQADSAVFGELIESIKASAIEHKEPLISAVEDMASNYATGTWLNSYKTFMDLAASHVTVLGPLLPALAALL